jgi:transposase
VKAAEQQAAAIVLSARELLVRQRTQLVNAVRGHAAEFGIVAAKNISHLPALESGLSADRFNQPRAKVRSSPREESVSHAKPARDVRQRTQPGQR